MARKLDEGDVNFSPFFSKIGGDHMGKEQRLTFYDIAASQAHSVKTFDGKTYELKGAIAIENGTGSIEKVAQIYYRVRSVRDEHQNLIAKRKHKQAELVAVKQKCR